MVNCTLKPDNAIFDSFYCTIIDKTSHLSVGYLRDSIELPIFADVKK